MFHQFYDHLKTSKLANVDKNDENFLGTFTGSRSAKFDFLLDYQK